MRGDHIEQGVDHLRQLVIQLLPDLGGKKCRPLQQTLNIGVCAFAGEHGRKGRMFPGEGRALLAQSVKLPLVVF